MVKMKKIKINKKIIILLSFLILLFLLFIYFYFKAYSYELEYMVSNIKVIESYDKNNQVYKFNISNDVFNFEIVSFDKYINTRKLISNININDNNCISFDSNVSLYPICFDENKYYSSLIDNSKQFQENKNYENIAIDNLNNKTYLLWNYKDFIYLSDKKQTKINLFNKDIYNLSLNYQFDKYLIIPDYEQDYIFNKAYVINVDKSKVNNIKLRYELYFDSYFLGNDKNNVYIYDLKAEQEYYLDLKKEDIYKTSYKLLNNGKWEDTTNQKLKNDRLKFSNYEAVTYLIEDNILFMNVDNYYLQLSKKDVSKIIKYNNLDVYYLSDDTLYYFNPFLGKIPLLKYSEWQFNNQNMIFIFD